MTDIPTPSLSGLWIADPPEKWEAIGFAVDPDGAVLVDGIEIHLGGPGDNITAWAIRDLRMPTDDVDGLPTHPTDHLPPQPPVGTHPNGVTGIDHVVIVTPDFGRTQAKLEATGLPLKRIRSTGTFRQGFRRLGPAILELVEIADAPEPGQPARFWGLTFITPDLEALTTRLGPLLHPIKPAVQPGRHIATLDRTAGLTTNVAFMTPEGP
jgi:hypothetical protein